MGRLNRARSAFLLTYAVGLTLAGGPAFARTVVVTAEVYGSGMTPAEARHEVLQRAREKAVAEVAGVDVAAQQLRLKSERPEGLLDTFTSLIRTSSQGRILDEQVSYRTWLEGDVPVYAATLRAEVVVEEGRPDPGFVLELAPDPASHTFRHGESVSFDVMASRRCFLTVLNVLSDGTVVRLFPNRYGEQNLLEAGQRLRLPMPSQGFEIRAELSAGRKRDHEQILAIATLDRIPLSFEVATEQLEERPQADLETTLTALNRWLLQIPVARRTEVFFSYEIVR